MQDLDLTAGVPADSIAEGQLVAGRVGPRTLPAFGAILPEKIQWKPPGRLSYCQGTRLTSIGRSRANT